MRAVVIMPRSPTSATCPTPKRRRILSTREATVVGSAVLPGNTSTATGQPSAAQSRPQVIWRLPYLAVAVVAEGRERAVRALRAARGDVVQDRRVPALQVPVGQAFLDPGLAFQQPVEHGEHLVAGHLPEPEQGAEAAGRGLRRRRP